MKKLEVCFSPKLLDSYQIDNKAIVVVDILRATTIITTMFKNGLSRLLPVGKLEEAKELKERKGYLVAAERNGEKVGFADFDNSPFTFTSQNVQGKTIVYSSTNGTNTINSVKKAAQVIIASFLNLNAIAGYLLAQQKDVIILCSGWQGNYCTEDALFAGALSDTLLTNEFNSNCDSTYSSIELWRKASQDLLEYARNITQYKRLLGLGLNEQIMKYCFSTNLTNRIPVLDKNYIIDIENLA